MVGLLLVAAGGLAREVLASVRDAGRDEVIGILDDDAVLHGTTVDGIPVVGGIDDAPRYAGSILLCAGQGRTRAALATRLTQLGVDDDRYSQHVHPSVMIGGGIQLGTGSIILAGSVLTCDLTVGSHVVLMPRTVLTHDDQVADFVTCAAGVCVAGRVDVGPRAYLGMNSSVRQDLEIGADAVIGMGSVVLEDVPAGDTWVGNPARKLHSHSTSRVPDVCSGRRTTRTPTAA